MKIEKDTVVAFSYILSDAASIEFERSPKKQPNLYLHGYGNILAGLEQALLGKEEGDQVNVELPAEKAYGLRVENSQQRFPIKHLVTRHKKYKPGMAVKVNTNQGPKDVVILKVGRFNVDVDNNHPLAGKAVIFDVTIKKIRQATREEITHGHPHGIDGHASH
ncbi:MAG: peptidylprolyl isomerase [Pseudomonadales bacterium]|nr:peptidylprolyl isomerase [Pseudomonadales bacterium]